MAKRTQNPSDPKVDPMERIHARQTDLTLQSVALYSREARRALKQKNREQANQILDQIKAYVGSIQL